MDTPTDPRTPAGDIAGPGGPHERYGVVINTDRAVLLRTVDVALVEPYRDGEPDAPVCALLLGGRINQTEEQAKVLFVFDADGAAAIISQLVGLATRAHFGERFLELLNDRLGDLPDAGDLRVEDELGRRGD